MFLYEFRMHTINKSMAGFEISVLKYSDWVAQYPSTQTCPFKWHNERCEWGTNGG